MKASERRTQLIEILFKSEEPVSASSLAGELGVSRQIIVGDIALLRASGNDIVSTPRGYILKKNDAESNGLIKRIACCHSSEQMVDELQICINYGCSVLDVIVEHPVYGQLTGQLRLSSLYDIQKFEERVYKAEAHSLSELTDGIHIHTLACPDEDAFERVTAELREKGYLYEE